MVDFLSGIASGIVGTALIGIGLHAFPRIRAWYAFRAFRKIWHPFVISPTKIVLTGKREGHTIKASANELDAETALRTLLPVKDDMQRFIGEDQNVNMEGCNIITLGSERANEVTRALLQSVAGDLDFYYTADTNLVINGEPCVSRYQDDVLVQDYGFICKAKNPYSRDNKFLVISGNHGVGTQGAALALTDRRLTDEIIQKVGDADFYAVIQVHADRRFARRPTELRLHKCGLIVHPIATTPSGLRLTREKRVSLFLEDLGADAEILKHAESRARLATRIAHGIRSKGTDLDVDAVYLGAMFHDVGRVKSGGIDHAVLGVEMIRDCAGRLHDDFGVVPSTLKLLLEAIECHVVGGIPQQWIEEAGLKLPKKSYVPTSLEAKIVAFCDQILHSRDTEETVFKEAPQYDPEVYKRLYSLTRDVVAALFRNGSDRTQVEGTGGDDEGDDSRDRQERAEDARDC